MEDGGWGMADGGRWLGDGGRGTGDGGWGWRFNLFEGEVYLSDIKC